MLNKIFNPKSHTITIDQIDNFLTLFRLPKVVDIKQLAEGVQSVNFIVKTIEQNYLVKILRDHRSRYRTAVDLLQFLANRGHPVSFPIFQKSGKIIDEQFHHGSAVLLSHLNGEPRFEYYTGHILHSSEELAKLHLSMSDFHKLKRLKHSYPFPHLIKQCLFEFVKKDHPDLKQKVDETHTVLNQLLRKNLTHGLCHNDICCDHLLFTEDRLTGILDFFAIYEFPYLFDISSLFLTLCFDLEGKPNYEYLHLAIEAYRKCHPLTDAEWKLLPDALRVTSLIRHLIHLAKNKTTSKSCYLKAYDNITKRGVQIG